MTVATRRRRADAAARATGSRSTASPARSSRGSSRRSPSEVVQVLVEKTLAPEDAPVYREFAELIGWADEARRLGVRANADQPDQAATAVAFGAQGIGLCRTEHMFFGEGKIGPMREMIVAETDEERRAALAKLLPLQREDFRGHLRGDGAAPGDHPHHRPAAARVPPPGRGGDRRAGARHRQAAGADPRAHRGAARVEPHARPPRLPARHLLPGDHRDAGARHLRGGLRRGGAGREGRARGDDPARRRRSRSSTTRPRWSGASPRRSSPRAGAR